jgi:hypothetical protein
MTGNMVNKLTVDRDAGFSNERRTVHMLRYTGDQLAQRNLYKIVDVVYKNFEELADISELKHTGHEIARLLTSPKSTIIFGVYRGQIISYLIAEITVVEDLKQLMHREVKE